ncbi:MAG: DUF447 family protein [Fuerstiella sp.]|nr:DUF447 family protein [Fuerstiella sp.]
MIIEGVVTSLDSAGNLNVAPMGPMVQGDFERLVLRPFRTSTTFRNLHENACGVFHVVDSVELLSKAAIGQLKELPPTRPASRIDGRILFDCCRWFEFRITDQDLSHERSVMNAEVVACGEQRPFFGFNRARHAVIEAAILATRVHLLPHTDVTAQMTVLKSAVEKTGGVAETDAFDMLQNYIEQSYKQTL